MMSLMSIISIWGVFLLFLSHSQASDDESYEKDQVMHVPLGLEHPSSDVETGFREMCVGEKRLLTVPHHGQGDRDLPLQNGHHQYIYKIKII